MGHEKRPGGSGAGAGVVPPCGSAGPMVVVVVVHLSRSPDLSATMDVGPPVPPVHLVVLCGLVGSGKSTLACAAVDAWPGTWRRCSQDELGSRRAVERQAREALLRGEHVLIDRTNMDREQRAHWLRLAHKVRPVRPVMTSLLWLDVDARVCWARLAARQGHPTLRTPAQAHAYVGCTDAVCYRFSSGAKSRRRLMPPRALTAC